MDLTKLSKVTDSLNESEQKKINGSKKLAHPALRKASDSQHYNRLNKRVADSKSYRTFRVTDSFKELKKKIKDALEETEDTESAVLAVSEFLQSEPAEQVVASALEVIGEVVDLLEERVEKLSTESTEDLENVADSEFDGRTVILPNGDLLDVFQVEKIDSGYRLWHSDGSEYTLLTEEEFKQVEEAK